MLSTSRNKFTNYTFKIKTPEGNANVIIVEDSPGKIGEIFFNIGKAGSSIDAFCYALSRMTLRALEHGRALSDIITDLSNITSARRIYDADGIPCRSGPEALYIALYRYNILTRKSESVTYDSEYRAPKFGSR